MTIWKALVAAYSSRKLWMFLVTAAILWFGLERVIWHLYALPTEKCGFLINVSIAVFGVLICAAGAYMGFSTKYDAGSVVNALNQVRTSREDRTEQIVEEYANKFRDDPSYAPITEDIEEDFR